MQRSRSRRARGDIPRNINNTRVTSISLSALAAIHAIPLTSPGLNILSFRCGRTLSRSCSDPPCGTPTLLSPTNCTRRLNGRPHHRRTPSSHGVQCSSIASVGHQGVRRGSWRLWINQRRGSVDGPLTPREGAPRNDRDRHTLGSVGHTRCSPLHH